MKRTVHFLVLIMILGSGLLLRVSGLNWDDYAHIHPDERFLTSIVSRIGNADNLLDTVRQRCPDSTSWYAYFNTDCSVFNPNNIDPGSYAYGTLPLFLVYGAAKGVTAINLGGLENPADWATFNYIHLIGRALSALADTLSILFVYLIGRRILSTNGGLIAAALYAFAVLPIQLSHYWTVDAIAHLCFIAGLYAAVEISLTGRFAAYLGLGVAIGAALASRINLYPMLLLLPSAVFVHWLGIPREQRRAGLIEGVLNGIAVLALAALCFRIFQPYAFVGPSISHWAFNETWLHEIDYVSTLSRLPTDGWPPSVQWFNRIPFVYAWFNMTAWGMGLPFGIAASVAFAAAMIQQVRRRQIDRIVAVLCFWVIGYFLLTGGLHQMTMRYYLPLYSPLGLLAVWGLLRLPARWKTITVGVIISLSGVYALGFVQIYAQPITRVAASAWMNEQFAPTIALVSADGELTAAHVGDGAFNRMAHIAYKGESYIGEPFEIAARGDLLGVELDFLSREPVRGRVRILDENQAERVVMELSADEADRQLLFSDALAELPAGRYQLHMQFEWDSDAPFRLFFPMAIWNTLDGLLSRPLKLRSPYPYVPYINPVDPLQIRTRRAILVSEVRLAHTIGAPDSLLLQSADQTSEARRDSTWGEESPLGASARYLLDTPLTVLPDETLMLQSGQNFFVTGSAIATEGSWDDALPLRYCTYQQVRWIIPLYDECTEVHPIAQGHFVALPLEMAETDSLAKQRRMMAVLELADYLTISSNRFYDAQPRVQRRFSMSTAYYEQLFQGALGYERLQTFQRGGAVTFESLPTDGLPAFLNELEPEEAFTVYDHPTVFIFRNTGFNRAAFPTELPQDTIARSIALDLKSLPAPTYRLNSEPISDSMLMVTTIAWCLGIFALGWLVFPIIFVLFPALPLHGFMIGRGFAWLMVAAAAWWLTSSGTLFFWTQAGLSVLIAVLIAGGAYLAYTRQADLIAYVRTHWRALLAAEILFIGALLFGLILRSLNPDLWHPSLGGEKPMDFAYLNAILRTPVFPAPNPWFAGYPINYYYFGFVIAAVPIKLGNVASEIGVNLVLATLYAVLVTLFFTLAYAIMPASRRLNRVALATIGTTFVFLSGNLGTLWLLLAPETNISPHRWYWYPTRILGESANHAGGAINEFPIFSFLFGDLHAHILALLPTSLLLITLWLIVRTRREGYAVLLGVLLAVLYMTNTWDVLLYAPLVVIILLLTIRPFKRVIRFGIITGASGLALALPYLLSFKLGEANGVTLWTGEHSLIDPFLLVWGIPIGVIGLWLAPRLKRVFFSHQRNPVLFVLVVTLIVILLALPSDWATSLLCVFLVAVAALLAWRDDPQVRIAHVGAGVIAFVLLALEHIVVRGDVGRMNTVFKVSFQLWLWVGLTIPILLYYLFLQRRLWAAALTLILIGLGLLYPMFAIPARYKDNQTGKITLNGNNYFSTLHITKADQTVAAADDLPLITYMRANIDGFPIIAEWYATEYQWNSRIAVQTGLPSLVGWANHLRQQFSALVPLIEGRIRDIQALYTSGDPAIMRTILEHYGIDYVVFGGLERLNAAPDTEKALNQLVEARLLRVIFEAGNTRLYQVIHTEGAS